MKQFKDKVSILVLDYNKPEESRLCLESVKKHCLFEKEVIFYSNGGEQDYAIDFYKEGLIDKLVLSKQNWGLGIGTTDLLQLCRTEYFIYLQNDQYFCKDLDNQHIEYFISILKEDRRRGCISLAGTPCGLGIYSDRCHFANIDLFRSFDKWKDGMPDGGCGPFWNGSESYNENFIQKAFEEFGLLALVTESFVQDNGKTSIRENPDGSIFKHNPDDKKLWVIKKPETKQLWPEGLTEEEWAEILNGEWPEEGKIPENWKKDSFMVEGWH